MDISFAWTTKPLLDYKKDVTRRDWSDDYAKRFPVGSIHNATDKQRRFGGKVVGKVQIISIRREPLQKLLDDIDYGFAEIKREGGLWEWPTQFVEIFRSRGLRYGTGDDPYRIEFQFLPAA